MLITPNQRIKHETSILEPGQQYDIPDALAYYFIRNDWVDATKLQKHYAKWRKYDPNLQTGEKWMIIEPNQDFKHDIFTFVKGKKYDIPEALGLYFVNNGWASAEGVKALHEQLPELTGDQVLEVHDGVLGTTSD
jgi:hypothetical protein